jgi:prepilin peptidase CpaA
MPHSELTALLDLLATLFLNGRTGVLTVLLLMAAVFDARSHRIPNWLVVSGAVYALIYNTLLPPWPNGTLWFPLAGLALGLLLFFPLYLLRVMGAGDVKLLAMVGAFVGPHDLLRVALASLIAGGVLAIAFVMIKGTAPRMFHNLNTVFGLGFVQSLGGAMPNLRISPGESAGKLPYGIAIAAGTMFYLVLHRLGFI